jgi:CO dehydrogenase/acetyl-CoA synthase beta subunit|nr:MAG TPA: hypothetical protein [Caudoviricetes sp.]
MSFMMCLQGKHKAKVFSKGNTIDSLIMTTTICKAVVDKIATEKKLSTEDALNLLIESVRESYSLLNWPLAEKERKTENEKENFSSNFNSNTLDRRMQ